MQANHKQFLVGPVISLFSSKIIFGTLALPQLMVLSAHEAGHFYAARSENLEPDLPMILGLGPISLGYVKTKKGTQKQRSRIAAHGPLGGLSAAFVTLLFASLIGSTILATAATSCVLWELYNLLLGPDSKKVFV